ncbi:MAG TPA: hypothetical protein VN457_00240, partial [Chlamydiales bacterium]|nr:hypothetical protein [Chlamydiales bacterium]
PFQLTDDAFRHLKPLTKLEALHLSHGEITHEAFRHLDGYPIKSLCVMDCPRLTNASFGHIFNFFRNNITDLYLGNSPTYLRLFSTIIPPTPCPITDKTVITYLPRLKKLQRLSIGLTQCTKQGIQALAQLGAVCPNFEALTLRQGALVDDATILALINAFKASYKFNFLKVTGRPRLSKEMQQKCMEAIGTDEKGKPRDLTLLVFPDKIYASSVPLAISPQDLAVLALLDPASFTNAFSLTNGYKTDE